MTPEVWQKLKALLDGALEREAGSRGAYLREACGGDAELLARAESLIAASEEEWTAIDTPTSWLVEPGKVLRIGAYEVVEEIGHGGMGTVYVGRRADEEFKKRVAIKLVRRGMDTDFVLRRFKTERQILASLEHTNIARLLDGGATADGRPYFVMEYVEGQPLLDFCDSRCLSIAERLKLFLDVCSAVQFAHQNLVVHRDLKPANLLVTADGVVKLLDFGIAKVLNPGLAAGTLQHTASVTRLMTPDYASPEQVKGEPITTSSDVYSLGVLLYELLTGHRPYRVTSAEPVEVLRVVCERNPEKPSTAVTRQERIPARDGAAAITVTPESVSRTREGEPGRLRRRLKGDLDNIVLMAMRKEPQRRYSSVEQFAEDIRRHLAGRPVIARKDTLGYRTERFVRRNRFPVATAVLTLVALATGLVLTLREARRARAAEARAERRFNDVRTLANSFLFEFHDAIRDLPGSTPARALVVRRALEYLDGLARESAGNRELRRELAEAYQKVGDVEGNPYHQNLGDLKGALASYDKAIALLEPVVASAKATDAERSTLANAYLVGGGIRVVAGDSRTAVAMAEKGLALRRGLAERNPGDARRATDLAQAWQFYAFSLSAAGRTSESYEALLKQAAILTERLAATPADRQLRRGLGQNLYLTAGALQSRGDFDGSRKKFEEAALVNESLLREDPGSVQFRRDLGWTRMDLGSLYRDRKDPRAAIAQYQLALSLFEWIVAADPKNTDGRLGVGMSHQYIGLVRRATDGPTAALQDFEKARSSYEPILAADPSNAYMESRLANLYLDIGEAEEDGGKASSPGHGQTRFERACRFYSLASETFARMKGADRLPEDRVEASEKAMKAVARCRGNAAVAATRP